MQLIKPTFYDHHSKHIAYTNIVYSGSHLAWKRLSINETMIAYTIKCSGYKDVVASSLALYEGESQVWKLDVILIHKLGHTHSNILAGNKTVYFTFKCCQISETVLVVGGVMFSHKYTCLFNFTSH